MWGTCISIATRWLLSRVRTSARQGQYASPGLGDCRHDVCVGCDTSPLVLDVLNIYRPGSKWPAHSPMRRPPRSYFSNGTAKLWVTPAPVPQNSLQVETDRFARILWHAILILHAPLIEWFAPLSVFRIALDLTQLPLLAARSRATLTAENPFPRSRASRSPAGGPAPRHAHSVRASGA